MNTMTDEQIRGLVVAALQSHGYRPATHAGILDALLPVIRTVAAVEKHYASGPAAICPCGAERPCMSPMTRCDHPMRRPNGRTRPVNTGQEGCLACTYMDGGVYCSNDKTCPGGLGQDA